MKKVIFFILFPVILYANHMRDTAIPIAAGDYPPISVCVSDMDNDGLNDIVLNGYWKFMEEVRAVILKQRTDKAFTVYTLTNSAIFWNKPGLELAVGDMNKDGKKDIVFMDYWSLSIMYQDNINRFSFVTQISIPYINTIRLADLNSDSRDDIIVGYRGGIPTQGGFVYFIQQAGGGFGPIQYMTNTGVHGGLGLEVFDINRDGKNEVITSYQGITVWTQSGSGFAPWYNKNSGYDYLVSLAVMDVNMDGIPDVVAGFGTDGLSGSTAGIGVYLQDGSGGLNNPLRYGTADFVKQIKTADMDHNGLADIVAFQKNRIDVFYRMNASLIEKSTINYSRPNFQDDFDVGDLNNDGLNDVIVLTNDVFSPALGDQKCYIYYQNSAPKPEFVSLSVDSVLDLSPVMKLKAADAFNDDLFYKIEISKDDFRSVLYAFDMSETTENWNKSIYASGETAEFKCPILLKQGVSYSIKGYSHNKLDWSEPVLEYFSTGVQAKALEHPNLVFSPNGDGINDNVVFQTTGKAVSIYNKHGNLVRKIEGDLLIWDGKDGKGNQLASGVYLFQITEDNKVNTGTIIIVR